MAHLGSTLRALKNVLVTKLHTRTFRTSNTLKGREFLLSTTNLPHVKEEAKSNPFPVRYLEFTACQSLYEVFARYGLNKSPSGVQFNAAYVDTNPNAKTSTPVVVCLHGSPGGHWDFNHLTIHLANKGYRVIAINFPGYGWTEMDEFGEFENSGEEKASFVKDFLYCLGIEKVRMGIVHSAGVYPGLLLSGEVLKIFQSLALINPGGLGHHKVLQPYPLLRFHARFYRNPLLKPFLLSFLKLALLVTGFGKTNAMQMSIAIESLAGIPYDQYKNYPNLMSYRQFPSVLIHSTNDRFVESELSMELGDLLSGGDEHVKHLYDKNGEINSIENADADVKHIEHHIFSDGGHFVMKKYPQVVNDIIEKFLKNLENKIS